MPFDQTFPQQADLLAVESLRNWLLTKDPSQGYTYTDSERCLLYQYLAESRVSVLSVGGATWHDENLSIHHIPKDFRDIAVAACDRFINAGVSMSYTFGGALERCNHVLNGG